MLVAQGPVILYTLGLFIKPLSLEFGWDRASISAAGGNEARDRDALRQLMKEDGDEHHQTQARAHQERARDRHAIEERMEQ